MSRRWRWWALGAGLCLAALYSLTPLTICVVAAAMAILPLLSRALPDDERRWVTAMLVVALLARLVTIAAVFARNLPNHDDQFVGATSGDEAYAMSRALRMRDIVRGRTTDTYDYFVAFDEYGRNSYVSALTAVQVVLGPTPYSLRLLNALLFTIGALLLFRLSREAFGFPPAFGGLALVLFWPSLFAWSISLLKEPLYFAIGAVGLVSAISVVRSRSWPSRAAALFIVLTAGAMVRDLRPGAVVLLGSGLAVGAVAYAVSSSKRTCALAALALVVLAALALSQRAVEARLISGLETAAKTHAGHVFTVGHSYKLLDAGFYLNPQAPISSTLTLTRDEAMRFVIRAAGSFLAVPVPWQLQSARELAYLPEQVAWYALLLLLPIGVVAGGRRDRLVTCMLVGYVLPTAAALALTNGNIGTLLRLRGLVVPYLVWIGAVGFLAVLGAAGRGNDMQWIDEDGRLFGRVNLFDAAVVAFAMALIPAAYGTFLLFRTPALRLSSVTRVPISKEERRVAGGNRLTAKLKVRGSGLRPMLRASIDGTPTLGFVFENPNSADVLVGAVPPGTHDLVLYDGVQEVGRLQKSVTIEATDAPRVAVVGTLVNMDTATSDALTAAPAFHASPAGPLLKLGDARPQPDGRQQRPLEILLPCDPDSPAENCAVGGVTLTSTPRPTLKLPGPSGADLTFAVSDVFPSTTPATVRARVRLTMAPEIMSLIHVGDRDDCLDNRAAVVNEVSGRHGAEAGLDVAVRLGADQSPEGRRYRGLLLKPGAPFSLTTTRYVVTGTVLTIEHAEEDPK